MERMMFRRLILIVSLGLAGVSLAAAEAPDVTAVLTSSETEVGRPVQLQIKVSGDPEANPPSEIAPDGLHIRYTGQSQLVESRNFHFSYSVVFNYTVLPLKAGTFTIPAQVVRSRRSSPRRRPKRSMDRLRELAQPARTASPHPHGQHLRYQGESAHHTGEAGR